MVGLLHQGQHKRRFPWRVGKLALTKGVPDTEGEVE